MNKHHIFWRHPHSWFVIGRCMCGVRLRWPPGNWSGLAGPPTSLSLSFSFVSQPLSGRLPPVSAADIEVICSGEISVVFWLFFSTPLSIPLVSLLLLFEGNLNSQATGKSVTGAFFTGAHKLNWICAWTHLLSFSLKGSSVSVQATQYINMRSFL